MPRGLVVLYLIVATLAGPRLCPCPASLAAAPSAPPVSGSPVPRACGCSGTPTSTTSTAPQAHDQPSAPCQCQCGKPDTAAAVRAVWRAGKSSADHDGLPAPVHARDVPRPSPGQPACGFDHVRDLPFCTTHDLLYVFHRLRC